MGLLFETPRVCALLQTVCLLMTSFCVGQDHDCNIQPLPTQLTRIASDLENYISECDNQGLFEYKVTVHTGTIQHAQSSAPIFATLYGEFGSCGENLLRPSSNSFEAGSEEEFQLYCEKHLGTIRVLKMENKEFDGLRLESASVEDLTNDTVYDFPCDCWLDEEGTHKLIQYINAVKRN